MDRIIAEMKRRLDGFREEMKKGDSITGCMTLAGRCAALEEMIEYIETLQKESVSDDLVKVAEDYANKHSVLLGFDCDSEPIQTGTDIKNAVIYGAGWQKEQIFKIKNDEKLFSEEENGNFEDEFAKTLAERKEILPKNRGFSELDLYRVALHFCGWKKRQMMKDIKEAHVIMTHITNESIVPSLSAVILDDSFKEGDKVRFIIIKES